MVAFGGLSRGKELLESILVLIGKRLAWPKLKVVSTLKIRRNSIMLLLPPQALGRSHIIADQVENIMKESTIYKTSLH